MIRGVISSIICFVVFATCLIAPFVSWGKTSAEIYLEVAAKFAIDPDMVDISFNNGRVLNASTGEMVGGTSQTVWVMNEHGEFVIDSFIIQVQESIIRPMTVSTIFHEVAHAAQDKHGLWDSSSQYSREQHAELLAFNLMWRSGYWWNAIHMLFMHSFKAKPSEYIVTDQLWSTAFTGARTVDFRAFA